MPHLDISCADSALLDSRPSTAPTSPPTTPGSLNVAALPPGIYVPVTTFFKDDAAQSLDTETYERHITWLAHTGLQGILVLGSTGEAVTLTAEESIELIRITRRILSQVDGEVVALLVGVACQSTQEAILKCRTAAAEGGDYALLLPPGYYAPAMSKEDLINFYVEVANASPIPVIIYSYPGVSSGLELNSEDILQLAQHPNISGIKQTDANIGKMSRLASGRHALFPPVNFRVLGGASDYLLGALAVGGDGTITGMGNLAPRACVHAFQLWWNAQNLYETEPKKAREMELEARAVQAVISKGEWAFGRGMMPGTKFAMQHYLGYGGICRRPLSQAPRAIAKFVVEQLADLVELEKKLTKAHQ